MDPAPDTLGQLLSELAAHPKAHDLRVRAARKALSLCFRKGDPHYADVAESLIIDAPRRFPKAMRAELDRLVAQASAIRRAVAMAHGQAHNDPLSLAAHLAQDPDQLATEVQRCIDAEQPALARAVLEVGLARHRDHQGLRKLQLTQQERWPMGVPPSP